MGCWAFELKDRENWNIYVIDFLNICLTRGVKKTECVGLASNHNCYGVIVKHLQQYKIGSNIRIIKIKTCKIIRICCYIFCMIFNLPSERILREIYSLCTILRDMFFPQPRHQQRHIWLSASWLLIDFFLQIIYRLGLDLD